MIYGSPITYIPSLAGFLYLAVVVDAWSRRVIGWCMVSHLRTEFVSRLVQSTRRAIRKVRQRMMRHANASRPMPC